MLCVIFPLCSQQDKLENILIVGRKNSYSTIMLIQNIEYDTLKLVWLRNVKFYSYWIDLLFYIF